MLSRIACIPLGFKFASSIPQALNTSTKSIAEYNRQATIASLEQLSINFEGEIDGKNLILLAEPEDRSAFNVSDVATSLFSVATGWSLISNFSYILTLIFAAGTISAVATAGRVNVARGVKLITSIQIDRDQRLHVSYSSPRQTDTLIVDKKDFQYNVIKQGSLGIKGVWCRANGLDFYIPSQSLRINNQQFHHLL